MVLTLTISWIATRELMRTNEQIVHSTGSLLIELGKHFSTQMLHEKAADDKAPGLAKSQIDTLKRLTGNGSSLSTVQVILPNNGQGFPTMVFKRASDGTVSVTQTPPLQVNPSDTFHQAMMGAFQGQPKSMLLNPMNGSLSAFIPVTEGGKTTAVLRLDSSGEINGIVRRHPSVTEVLFEFLLLQAIGILTVMRIGSSVKNEKDQESKVHAQSMAAEHERLELVVNSVNGVLWERDVETGELLIVSSQAEGFLGYTYDRWFAEPGFQASIIHPDDRQQVEEAWKQVSQKAMRFHLEYRARKADDSWAWISEDGTSKFNDHGEIVICGMLRDQTEHHNAAAAVDESHRLMVDAARQAGMAEIANGVLHNVGNVLNSLNVLAKLHTDMVSKSRVGNLGKAARLLQEHDENLVEFLTENPQGKSLPRYMASLSEYLVRENGRLYSESRDIVERIEHISDIISLQQQHGRVKALRELVDLATLLDDALRLEGSSLSGMDIKVVRHYADMPTMMLPSNQLLQVFVNLISNARHAMSAPGVSERTLTLSISPAAGNMVRVCVEDTGCGIPEENISRLFVNGFTTRSDGNGFGLHHSGLVVQDMGGTLAAESEGRGQGARFILEIPLTENLASAGPRSLQSDQGTAPLPKGMPFLRPMTQLQDSGQPANPSIVSHLN